VESGADLALKCGSGAVVGTAAEAPSGWIYTKFGLVCPPTDVINCAEFCCSQLMGFDSVIEGSKILKIRHLPLTWPVAVNTVLALPRSL